MYETHWEDEANHSMQSYANIQSSTLIQSEKHSFQYGIFDQNIANHSNSSTTSPLMPTLPMPTFADALLLPQRPKPWPDAEKCVTFESN